MMGLVRTICTAAVDLQSLRSHYSFALCGLIADLLSKASEARPSFKDVLDTPFLQETIAQVYKGLGPEVYGIQRQDGTRPSPPSVGSKPEPAPQSFMSPPPPSRPSTPPPPTAQTSPPPPTHSSRSPPPQASPPPTAQQPRVHPRAAAPAVPMARGTEAHVAASILQRSFHRRFPSVRQPPGWSAAVNQMQGHNLRR